MKGIIYCSEYSKGNEMFLDILNNYEKSHIALITKHIRNIGSFAEFVNGDKWVVVKTGDNARGHRWNIAYIERNISYDIYRTIISPCAMLYPYNAIHLWGEGDLHINNIPSLPF